MSNPSRSNSPTRTAVILAAGMGSRLAGDEIPKPLRLVGGMPLLERTVSTLAAAGIEHAVIVVGYRDRLVRSALSAEVLEGIAFRAQRDAPLKITWVYNPAWQLANGVSALHARDHVPARFLLLMADHVMTAGMVRHLTTCMPEPGGAILMVDPNLSDIYDMDDATKVLSDGDGRIVDIGKEIPEYDVVDTGLFHCTHGLFDELEGVYAERGDASLSHGIGHLADAGIMRLERLPAGEWWQDVDTPDALDEAERRLDSRASAR